MKLGRILVLIGILEVFLAAMMLLLNWSEWTSTLIVSLIGLAFIGVGFAIGRTSK
ncbi:MAG: hypothetical protein MIO90_07835 [Methanomassiliicoccales archaeon]|nr:hypothetical protein [Methanomassiliicoccales archaeon]